MLPDPALPASGRKLVSFHHQSAKTAPLLLFLTAVQFPVEKEKLKLPMH
jgi:hypothetical protein